MLKNETLYFTYHDLKVNTDQIAYPNGVKRGQNFNVEIWPHFNGLHYLSLFQS